MLSQVSSKCRTYYTVTLLCRQALSQELKLKCCCWHTDFPHTHAAGRHSPFVQTLTGLVRFLHLLQNDPARAASLLMVVPLMPQRRSQHLLSLVILAERLRIPCSLHEFAHSVPEEQFGWSWSQTMPFGLYLPRTPSVNEYLKIFYCCKIYRNFSIFTIFKGTIQWH